MRAKEDGSAHFADDSRAGVRRAALDALATAPADSRRLLADVLNLAGADKDGSVRFVIYEHYEHYEHPRAL